MAPVVNTIGQKVLMLNESVLASDLFTASDTGGNPITRFRFRDTSSLGSTGFFRFNGNPVGNGTLLDIHANQLASLEFVGGTAIGNESIEIQAFNGSVWSSISALQVFFVTANVQPPRVLTHTVTVLENEIQSIAGGISYFDPDGWPAVRYQFTELTTGPNSGQLVMNNQLREPGVRHFIVAQNVGNVAYLGRRANEVENIRVRAFDGVQWGPPAILQVRTRNNVAPPAASFGQKGVSISKETGLTDILNWFDSDGNTAKQFRFLNTSDQAFAGSLVFNGETLAPKQWHTINAADIDSLTYSSANQVFSQTIRYRVFDGKWWSNIADLVIHNRARPVLTSTPFVVERDFRTFLVRNIFSKIDSGPDFTRYEVIDRGGGPNSGRLRLGGQFLSENTVHSLSPAQFNQLIFRTGIPEDRFLDTVMVRAYNGDLWTNWVKSEIRTEPEFDGVLRQVNGSIDNGFNDWKDWGAPTNVTYSFAQIYPSYETGHATADMFRLTTLAARTGMRRGFDLLNDMVNTQFVEVPDSATNIGGTNGGLVKVLFYLDPDHACPFGCPGYAFAPDNPLADESPEGGDMWFNLAYVPPGWNPGNAGHAFFLSQLGTAIGLMPGAGRLPQLPGTLNTHMYTVMGLQRPDFLNPGSFSLYDVMALQSLYGANMSTRTGDDVYTVANLLDGDQQGVRVLWDAGGNDTLSGAGSNTAVQIDLRQGAFSSLGTANNNVAIAFGANIENATGTQFNDTLIGNHLNNVLRGEDGNDTLWGNAGNDMMYGGRGNDTYRYGVGDGHDTISEEIILGDGSMAGAGSTLDRIVIDPFPQLDNISQDVRFRRDGIDLVIELTINRGEPDGSLRIMRQRWGMYRVEQLNFNGVNYDLTTVWDATNNAGRYFQPTGQSSSFGQLLSPIT